MTRIYEKNAVRKAGNFWQTEGFYMSSSMRCHFIHLMPQMFDGPERADIDVFFSFRVTICRVVMNSKLFESQVNFHEGWGRSVNRPCYQLEI